MLIELSVENLGIIEHTRLVLGAGMTAITGETGAGKTLLVDALELLVGGRADPAIVRDGATEARVEGRFVVDDEELVLSRVVPVEGRSRGYRDGRPVTAAQLAEQGRALVDLHGQHTHQSLLAGAEQRALLDRYAGDEALRSLQALRAAAARVRSLDEELHALGGDERSRAREADLLRYQAEEIAAAGLDDPAEEAALEAEEAMLADADAHRRALDTAHEIMGADAVDALGAAVAQLHGREAFAGLEDRLRALQAEAAEIAHDLRAASESVVADPDRLEAVRERRRLLRELCRKYGATVSDVRAYREELATRLADLEGHEERAAALTRERTAAVEERVAAAVALSEARRAAAPRLGVEVTAHLHDLALPHARFEVEVGAGAPTDDGSDTVTFLLAPNPGEPPRPLARAASGGELSRAMLALRLVLSEAPPTLIFDEVDAGIGGEAGVAVGRSLASLGGTHQVLCVTHLAQVAAFADAHVAVTKREARRRTVAAAEILLDGAREGELSRMLAGVEDSTHARRHARELLARAGDARRGVRSW